MGEDSFFDALAHIMWDLEVDIFENEQKTLAMAADYAPRCKKQRERLRVMYDCGAIKLIEQAVAAEKSAPDSDEYAKLMWQAADLLRESLKTSEERAVFAVNQVISLWGDELPKLEYEENEAEEGDDMILLDVAETEENEQTEEEQQEQTDNAEGEPAAERENIFKQIVHFWCATDVEDGRPLLVACPIGWIFMLLCAALGAFMVYDIPLGDKLTPPVFIFVFIVLLSKRMYRYESAGRLSIMIGLFYLAAGVRALWLGSEATLRCLPLVAAALVVFNNGRFSVFLDGEKRRPAVAYPLMILMSAAVAAGVYAIQNVQL